VIRVFKATDCLSSISGDKSLARKTFFDNDSSSQDKFWSAITQPHIKLKSCSNPLKLRDSCSLDKKIVELLGLGFLSIVS